MDPPSVRPTAHQWRQAALWAALCVVAVAAPAVGGDALLGSPGGEIYGHAWVQWWHAQALPGWPAGPAGLLPGIPVWTVIDVIPTAMGAAAGRVAGLVAGWNFTVVVAISLAAAGGAAVAHRAGGDPAVGAVALALAPALQGATASGLTEDSFVGVAAMGLALVGHRDWRLGALGGVVLGLVAWCGLVLAWTTALAALLLGAAILARQRDRWRSLLVGAVAAAVVVGPVAVMHGTRLSGRGHRMGQVLAQAEPRWQLNPWHGADLLSFVTPGRIDAGDALIRMHPGYLGLTLLVLATLAGKSRWWIVLVAIVALAPGTGLAFAGQPLGLDNPAWMAAGLLPFADLLNHHARVLLVAAVALAALAAVGATRLPRLARRLAPAVVALDLVLLSPIGLPMPTTTPPQLGVLACPTAPQAAPGCVDDLPDGVVLHLPMAGPGVHFQRPLLLQAAHGRPILLNPNHPGLPPKLAATPTGRWLSGVAFDPPPPPPDVVTLPTPVRTVIVEEPHVAAVEAVLGPPSLRSFDSAAWMIPAP